MLKKQWSFSMDFINVSINGDISESEMAINILFKPRVEATEHWDDT